MPLTSILIPLLGGTAIVWYYICLCYMGFVDPQPHAGDADGFRQFMGLSISTLSGTLATYVGMVLGVQSAAKEPETNRVAAVLQKKTSPLSWLQGIAAIAYVLSLIIALYAWWENRAAPDDTIVALGKSFLGLIGGVLAVILNVNVKE